jgi:hypothetical protein
MNRELAPYEDDRMKLAWVITALLATVTAGAAFAATPSVVLWTGEAGQAKLRWTSDDVALVDARSGVTLFSERQRSLTELKAVEREHEKDNAELLASKDADQQSFRQMLTEHGKPYCGLDVSWQVMSSVGPWVTVREDRSEFCMPAAHPWGGASFATLDARHPERLANLLELFPDKAVLEALLADRLVQRAQHDVGGPRPRSTRALLAQLKEWGEECAYRFDDTLLTRFAFHHLEGKRVAVRIGLPYGCEAARGVLTEIGILLPVPTALRPWLEAAAHRRGGFLMHDQAAISHGRQARLTR